MLRKTIASATLVVLILALGHAARATFPVTLFDDRNQEITIEREPRRIVAIGALYAQLVVDLGRTEQLVAVGGSADNPEAVAALPTVGPAHAPSIEVILGFEPDLVLGATDWAGERPALEAVGVTVLTTPWLTGIVSLFEMVRTIGTALGATEESVRLIGQMATEIVQAEALVLDRLRGTAAFLYAASPDDPPYGAGADTIEHELMLRAGCTNVFSDLSSTRQVSYEDIIARDPAVIFTAPSQLANLIDNPILRNLSAVADRCVFGIRASTVTSTRVAEALRAMIRAAHGIEF